MADQNHQRCLAGLFDKVPVLLESARWGVGVGKTDDDIIGAGEATHGPGRRVHCVRQERGASIPLIEAEEATSTSPQ